MTFQNFPKARQLLETTHWGQGQDGQQTTDRRQKDRQIFLGKYFFKFQIVIFEIDDFTQRSLYTEFFTVELRTVFLKCLNFN